MHVKNPLIFGLMTILLIGGSVLPAMSQASPENLRIVINEVEFNPYGNDVSEYVELYNPTSEDIDISGWTILTTSTWKEFTIPDNTIITSEGFATFNHVKYWFKDIGDNVSLYDDTGLLIDMTPMLADKSDDGMSWQRSSDGLDTDSNDDWELKTMTPRTSNGKIILEDVSQFILSTSIGSAEKDFGDTLTISGSVSERLYQANQSFVQEQIKIQIQGPNYYKTVSLYPDGNLEFSTALGLVKSTGVKAGQYTVTSIYGDYTDVSNFSVGVEIESPEVEEKQSTEQLSMFTDKESYIPGETVILSASTDASMEYAGLKYTVKNPDWDVVFSGTIFPNENFSTVHKSAGGQLYPFSTQLFMSTVKPVYGTYTVNGAYSFAGTGIGITSSVTTQTTFELVEDIKEDKPISLWTDKDVYEVGEIVKITGRSNDFWTEDLSLHIVQTGILTSQSYENTGSGGHGQTDAYQLDPLDETHSVKLNGDGTFEYDFKINDGANRNLIYGDYAITASEYFGEITKIIKVVENAETFSEVRTPLGLKIDKSEYHLMQNVAISGHILDYTPKIRDNFLNAVDITFIDPSGQTLQYADHKRHGDHTNCNLNDCDQFLTPLIFKGIPDQVGNYKIDAILYPNQFDHGTWTIKATYHFNKTVETVNFDITSAMDSVIEEVEEKEPIVFEICKSDRARANEIIKDMKTIVKGIPPSMESIDCSNNIEFFTGDKLVIKGKVDLQNPTSLDQSSTNPSGSTQTGHSYSTNYAHATHNYIEVSIPYPKSMSITKSTDYITVPDEGEDYHGGGGYGGGSSVNADGERIGGTTTTREDADRSTGYDGQAILKKQKVLLKDMSFKAYPDDDGNFGGLFELRPGVFASGTYTVKASYFGYQDEQLVTITDNSLKGNQKPSIIITTDKNSYKPGEIVEISGNILNTFYYDTVSVLVETPHVSQFNCFEMDCGLGNNAKKMRVTESVEGAIFSWNYKLGSDQASIGQYKVIADTHFGEAEKSFVVIDESSVEMTPKEISKKKIIDKFNRISDSDISISLDSKKTDDVELSPRVIQGSLFTAARGEESMVNIQVTTASGSCVIGQDTSCMVNESTRKPGAIYEIVTIDDKSYKIRYSGSDVRLEKFTILPELSGEQIDIKDWNVQIIKDNQPSRFYYKISYVNLE